MKVTAALLAALLWAPLASAQLRVEQGQIHSGAAAAASASFRVEGCLSHDPGGLATSASYTVYSGCGAAALLLAADLDQGTDPPPPPPPPPGVSVLEIPVASPLGRAVLLALLAGGGLLALRRQPWA